VRKRIFDLIDAGERDDFAGRAVNTFLILLILGNVLAVIFESVESFRTQYVGAFLMFEIFSVAIFSVEYGLRLWSCVEDVTHRYPATWRGRLRYALSPMAMIDFLAIAPFYVSMLFAVDLRFLRVFRLLRLLKITRYSPAIETLGRVLYNERRALVGALMFMLILLVFASSLMHMIERQAQPVTFGSIPEAMWWAVVTLTTVGYGDVAPITPLGKLLGGVVTLLGVGAFALPAGILASGFAQEFHKQNFIVTWNIVAKVPLFATLQASQIAKISDLLKPRIAVPQEVITRKGEMGDAMYFIYSGRVEVELDPTPIELKNGDFFGEISLIEHAPRTATVVAKTSCQLLTLRVGDFHELMETHPDLLQSIRDTAKKRLEETA
jgi:voltage-gated potassium channel